LESFKFWVLSMTS